MERDVVAVIDRAAIERTYDTIRSYIRKTPILEVPGEDLGIRTPALTLKLELLQRAGSFKTRGAFSNLLTREIPGAGIAAASGGNHGAAVAYAAMRLGRRARIFVPSVSSPAKIARIRSYGAELVVIGERYADALEACERWIAESGALPVHAFDQLETLLGQGTLGMELAAQAPDLDTVLVAVGGGGLIGGVAAWYAGQTRVVAVEPESAPTLTEALRAGHPVDAPAGGIAADSLAPRRVGDLMFPIARAYVDRTVLVSDDAIRHAQAALWESARVVAEPGGAAALAAILSGAYTPARNERVGVVVSGGNTSALDFSANLASATSRGTMPASRDAMAEQAKQPVDEDLTKGAVERAPDTRHAPPRDEQGRPKKAIETTEDVVSADQKSIKKAEHELGADEDGTPG